MTGPINALWQERGGSVRLSWDQSSVAAKQKHCFPFNFNETPCGTGDWSWPQFSVFVTRVSVTLRLPVTCLGVLTPKQHSYLYNWTSHCGPCYVNFVRLPHPSPRRSSIAGFFHSVRFGVNAALKVFPQLDNNPLFKEQRRTAQLLN